MNNQNPKPPSVSMAKTANIENIIEELKQNIEDEERKRSDIENNIDKFQKKIIEKRQNLGGINAGLENQSALTKQVEIFNISLNALNTKDKNS